MQVGGSVSGVTAVPAVAVTVDGVACDAVSVAVTRELAWSPDGSDAGITAATGRVDVAAEVSSRAVHPWGAMSGLPRAGASVTVGAGWGAPVRQLTGVVDGVSGSVGDGGARAQVVDLIDRLNVPVSWGPLSEVAPGNAGSVMRPGLSGIYLVDRCARAGGFCATPPQWSGSVVSVPLQGSARPERGFLAAAGRQSDAGTAPSWVSTAWGVAASDLSMQATPALTGTYPGTLDRPIQVSVTLGAAGVSGYSYAIARWASGYLGAYVSPGDTPVVQARIHDGSTSTTVCSLPRGGASTFSVLISPAGAVTIIADDGRTASGTAVLPAAWASAPMTRVDVVVPAGGAPLAGVQVAFSSSVIATAWKRTAILATPVRALPAIPSISGRTSRSVLADHARAVAAAWWLDEAGVLRWVDRDLLTSADPVATLTAQADLIDLGWASDLRGLASTVTVTYRPCAVRLSARSTVTLWRGRGETLESGEQAAEFVSPDADSEWLGVDTAVLSIYATGGGTALNSGSGTLTGGVRTQDGQADAVGVDGDVTTVIETLGSRTWKVTSTIAALPAGKALTMRTPSTPSISAAQQGESLPVLRGRGTIQWTEQTVTGVTTGPPGAPALEHDAAWHVGSAAHAQELADWIAARVTTATPRITSLPVIPDLRRQLGDVVIIEDQARTGVRLTGLITAISVQVDADPTRITQTLGVHVIDATWAWPTLAEVDTAWAGHTITDLDTARPDDTLTDVDTTPLEGL